MNKDLVEAGWSKGRSVDPSDPLARLESDGYQIEAWFSQAISEFHGLTIGFIYEQRADQIVLDVTEAVRIETPDKVSKIESRVDRRLLPIGYTYHEHLLLLVDEAGRWFGSYEFDLWRIGANAEEAVSNILGRTGFVEVQGKYGLTADDFK